MNKDVLPRTLAEYVKDERRRECPMCRLSADILSQFRLARRRKIPLTVVLRWLQEEHGIAISEATFLTHFKARHDKLG